MIKKLLFTALLILGFSCQDLEFAKKPKPLLEEEVMVDILTDLAIYDAALSLNEYKLRKFDQDMNKYLLRKYEVDSSVLAQNIAYYNENYEVNQTIYKQVGERIDAKRVYFDSIRKLNDSIKRLNSEKGRDSLEKKFIKEIKRKEN